MAFGICWATLNYLFSWLTRLKLQFNAKVKTDWQIPQFMQTEEEMQILETAIVCIWHLLRIFITKPELKHWRKVNSC